MNSTQSPNYANEVKQLPRIFYNRANTRASAQYKSVFPVFSFGECAKQEVRSMLAERDDRRSSKQRYRNVERAPYAVVS